ncbi:MAG: hypothetical protein ACI3XS_01315 [Eubacteriales bacterium]
MNTNEKYKDGETTYLWSLYEKGLDYQNKIGIRRDIPVFVKFFEGKQWPDSTENTKNLPRPVINIVKMICRNKKSSILSTPVRIIFKSYDSKTDVERFNAFAENLFKEMRQDEADKLAIDDAVKKGSYFYHYYWDASAQGVDGEVEGGLRCEIIDPLNIFFSNPAQTDEQKQKWILISSREEIKALRECADDGVNTGSIEPDGDDGDDSCTVLTRYFRINGEVFCERATKTCIINKPFPITPDTEKAREELFGESMVKSIMGEDIPCIWAKSKNCDTYEAKIPEKREKATLYPIVCGSYERREKSIYGISEVEGLIPNQKAINFNIAMSLLNAQEVAWGKYITLPNALKGQKISNAPGQVLVDYTGTGDGIKRMNEQTMSSAPMDMVETIINLTRSSCGSSEVMTGETIGTNMSGAAIAQLQSQAELPIEELRNEFWLVKQKQGRVILQFMKLFYYGRKFLKTVCKDDGAPFCVSDSFSSSDYQSAQFDVTVEATSGVKSSAASDISMLDECLKNGKISLETYIRAYPSSAITNKEEILRQIEREKKSDGERLRKENEELKKELEKSNSKLKEQSAAIDKITSLIDENERLKVIMAEKYTERRKR